MQPDDNINPNKPSFDGSSDQQPSAPLTPSAPDVPSFDTPAQPASPLASPVNPPSPTAAPSFAAAPMFSAAPPVPPAKPKRKKLFKVAIATVAALVVLGGASAAAYFGYYVPNKPESMLAEAINNTLQAKQMHTDGTITADVDGVSMKFALKGQSDLAAHLASGEGTLTFNGVDFSAEFRYVNDNLYFKIGDLETVKSLISTYAAFYSEGESAAQINSLVDSVSKSLSNQWILVDSTILKQANADCILNTDTLFTEDDVKLLQKQYKKDPFAKVTKHGSEDVDGKAAEKYDLTVDDDKATEYVESLRDLSIMKKAEKCTGQNPASGNTGKTNDHSSVSIWVDKASKRVVRISSKSTLSESSKGSDVGNADININLKYEPVSVTAPEGAKPVLQVLSELSTQLNQQFPGLGEMLQNELSSGGSGSTDILHN